MHKQKRGIVPMVIAILAGLIGVLAVCFYPAIEGFVKLNEGAIEACGTIFVAVFTCTLWIATQKLGNLALDQGDAMERSIAEQARAAEATNNIVNTTRENAERVRLMWQKQNRAYVSVDVGQATVYQDENLRFAATPAITNSGFTPARNVSYHTMAAVLDTHLRDDFVFEEFGNKNVSDVTLHPRQQFTVNSVVRERFPEHEVDAIMKGEAKRLYVWGVITYEDIFGDKWETRFCFNYIFIWDGSSEKKDVRIMSYIYRHHNSST